MRERTWGWLAAGLWIATMVGGLGAVPLSEGPMPGFRLPPEGLALQDMEGRVRNQAGKSARDTGRKTPTVVIFFSTRCPMSNAFNYRRNQLYLKYRDRVRFLMIDSNVNESLEEVRTYAQDAAFDFPVYRDVGNQVADRFGARNTTETFVLDGRGVVRYRGFIEDAPNPERTKEWGLRSAIDDVLAGREVARPDTEGIGCAIRRAHAPAQGMD